MPMPTKPQKATCYECNDLLHTKTEKRYGICVSCAMVRQAEQAKSETKEK